MAKKKTVFTEVTYDGVEDGITFIPQNRTLYADQFTSDGPLTDEDRSPFKPKNMREVFEHYQPQQNITLDTEDGGAVSEDFEFHEIKDFEDDQLIAQSEHLSAEQAKIDAYNSVMRQLKNNKMLRNALRDQAARGNLRDALRALLAELDEADN